METSTSMLQDILSGIEDKDNDINKKGKMGKTMLIRACEEENISNIEIIMSLGPDLNLVDCEGKTALIYATLQNHPFIVNMLLSAELDVNICDMHGRSALMYACIQNNAMILSRLIEAKANFDLADKSGKTAFFLSCERQYFDIANALLILGACINSQNKYGKSPLSFAVATNSTPAVVYLLSHSPNINLIDGHGKSPVIIACEMNFEAILVLLLTHHTMPDLNVQDNKGRTALIWACIHMRGEIVQLLLQCDINVDIEDHEGETALLWACKQRHGCVFKSLLRYKQCQFKKIYKKKRYSALTFAAELGLEEEVKTLLSNHPDAIDVKDMTGKTALLRACQNKHYGVIRCLLLRNPNIEVFDNAGWSVEDYIEDDEKLISMIKHQKNWLARRNFLLFLYHFTSCLTPYKLSPRYATPDGKSSSNPSNFHEYNIMYQNYCNISTLQVLENKDLMMFLVQFI